MRGGAISAGDKSNGALITHFFPGVTRRFRLQVFNWFVAGQPGTDATAEINHPAEEAATVSCGSGPIGVMELDAH